MSHAGAGQAGGSGKGLQSDRRRAAQRGGAGGGASRSGGDPGTVLSTPDACVYHIPENQEMAEPGFKMVVLVRCTVIGLILIIAGGYILVRSLQTLESLPDMGYGGNKMIEDSFGLTSPIGLGAIFMIVAGAISIAAGIVVTAVLSRKEKVRKKDENWTEK